MATQEETTLISTFFIGDTLLGVNAMAVQEIIQATNLTPVHHASGYIAGIINLRGQIVTVVDLRQRLEIDDDDEPTARNIFIVASQGENIGLLVEEAGDVVSANLDDLDALPANMSPAQQRFLKGICHDNAFNAYQPGNQRDQAEFRSIAILDINAVLTVEENEAASTGRR